MEPDFETARTAPAPDPLFTQAFSALLARFDYGDVYGLALLHRHFDLAEGEVLYETSGPARAIQVRPLHRDRLPDDATATLWRVEGEGLAALQHCGVHQPDQPEPPPPSGARRR